VLASIGRRLLEHEAELRAQLRLSLEGGAQHDLPLRQGRAVKWIEEALSPLRDDLGAADVRRLALAVRATFGIEPLVWLTDVAGLPPAEAVEMMLSSARTLVRAAAG
jgi:hypothetical protein